MTLGVDPARDGEAHQLHGCGLVGLAGAGPPGAIRGRGATDNPTNRFERFHYDRDEEALAAIRIADRADEAPLAEPSDEPALLPHPDTGALYDEILGV